MMVLMPAEAWEAYERMPQKRWLDHLPSGVHRWSYAARASTAGTFVASPTRMEEMYAPEVFGRTAAQTIGIDP
ncbi:MAG: hypothetical protein RMJ98_04935 [Myxococcales bacterium]|nr:hypothetical protein [Polyangiaceae bacterium]MDW8248635.1 hypothetical protein [Myxococcales bacterium]